MLYIVLIIIGLAAVAVLYLGTLLREARGELRVVERQLRVADREILRLERERDDAGRCLDVAMKEVLELDKQVAAHQ